MLSSASARTASLCALAVLCVLAVPGAFAFLGRRAGDDGLWSFVSRPDIHSPRWNIHVYDKAALAPGYWFLAPYKDHGKGDAPDSGWQGPHIYDQDGTLIWSSTELEDAERIRRVEGFTISQVDFGHGQGIEDVFTAMDMRGKVVFIDNAYQIRKHEKGAVGDEGFNSHELNVVDDGTRAMIVFTTYRHEPPEEELRRAGVKKEEKCRVACNGIAEYDVKSWERTWEWSSCDGKAGAGHIAVDESTLWRADMLGNKKCPHDYVHANSVDKTPQGDYLFSSRHTDTLYKISKTDGRIIWRLGGVKSDFTHIDDFKFSRQHHVRYRGGNATHTILSILDNAKANAGNQPPTYAHSRGLVIAVDEASTPMTAQIVAQYNHPDGEGNYAPRRGSCQVLPNGNAFMGWSETGLQSEHSANGTMLMQARFQSHWLGSYRAFKFDGFVGMPTNPPDVVAQVVVSQDANVGNRTEVFVSWNGATEVGKWRLLETDKSGKAGKLLASAPKTGFESRIDYAGIFPQYIVIEALARNDSVLATSRVVEVVEVVPAEPPSLLHSPLFIAAFAVTVAAALVSGAIWGLVTCLRRRKGGPSSRFLDLLSMRGRYRKLSSKQPDVGEGSKEPLMEDGEGWNEVVDVDEK
ncbi:hypothetical protein LTR37_007344 [Vermiconidia calcicola]|uniref:Uncharacterized protein n=1 Tax=Vermiconidia calcicola TaxID=1690605 RepID=A0ACC3NDQ1_9PEZI|nr:hypothetical protein LTR37_007344 [Vermiconidia calcicola]